MAPGNLVHLDQSLAKRQSAADELSDGVASEDTGEDGDGPALPVAVPVQGDGDGAEPGAGAGAEEAAEALVEGGAGAEDLEPVFATEPAGVDQGEQAQQRQVQRAEEGVRRVRQERRPQQHEQPVQRAGAHGGEYECYEDGLWKGGGGGGEEEKEDVG